MLLTLLTLLSHILPSYSLSLFATTVMSTISVMRSHAIENRKGTEISLDLFLFLSISRERKVGVFSSTVKVNERRNNRLERISGLASPLLLPFYRPIFPVFKSFSDFFLFSFPSVLDLSSSSSSLSFLRRLNVKIRSGVIVSGILENPRDRHPLTLLLALRDDGNLISVVIPLLRNQLYV